MLSTRSLSCLTTASALAASAALATSAGAVVLISPSTPVVDGADIANLTWSSSATDKTWTDTTNHGQSFTTGNDAGYTLNSFSMQVNSDSSADPVPADKSWDIRIVEIAGDNTTTTTVYSETGHVSTGTWVVGDWFTWVLDTPLELDPNKLYGIDVQMTAGGAWQPGIPYFRYNNVDDVANGFRYHRVDGDPTEIAPNTTRDRVFHIDLSVGGSSLPGDTDSDGDLDDSDLGNSLANYTGPVGNVGKTAAEGDTDGDGDIDDSDLGTSFANYTGPLSPTAVPEPTSLALLGLGGLLIARRRRA